MKLQLTKSKSIYFQVLVCLLGTFISFRVNAAGGGGGFAFHLPLEFRTRNVSVNGGGATTTQYLNVVPSFGYQYTETLYVGANYRYTNETGSTSFKGGVYGPSLGFTASSINITIAYYLGGSLTESTSGSETIYLNGTGPEFSIAYLFPASGNFAWGPQFMYSDIKYTSTQSGGNTTSSTYEISGIEPYIGLFFYF